MADFLNSFWNSRGSELARSDYIIPNSVVKPRHDPAELPYAVPDRVVKAARDAAASAKHSLGLLDPAMMSPGAKHNLSRVADLTYQIVDALQHPTLPNLTAPAWSQIAPTETPRSILDLGLVWQAEFSGVLQDLAASVESPQLRELRVAAESASANFAKEVASVANYAFGEYDRACKDAVLAELQREMLAFGSSMRDKPDTAWKRDMQRLYSPEFARRALHVAANALAAGMRESELEVVGLDAEMQRRRRDAGFSVRVSATR